MAGDPSIGFLALSIGAIFVFISSLAIVYTKYEDRRLAGFILPVATICALLSALLIFVKSFGERAGDCSHCNISLPLAEQRWHVCQHAGKHLKRNLNLFLKGM